MVRRVLLARGASLPTNNGLGRAHYSIESILNNALVPNWTKVSVVEHDITSNVFLRLFNRWIKHPKKVTFEASKEAFIILHPRRGWGEDFKLLDLIIDVRLTMENGVAALLRKARPKCRSLLRSRKFYSISDMIMQFKTHILGILESNIGGIYHATQHVLAPLDRILTTFVHTLNLEIEEAYLKYNLAPLALRRDIAMLGFLHKLNLSESHADIRRLFPHLPCNDIRFGHNKQFMHLPSMQRNMEHPELLRRSIFGLIPIYNALPQHVVNHGTVHDFQSRLITVIRLKCKIHHADWNSFLFIRNHNAAYLSQWQSIFDH